MPISREGDYLLDRQGPFGTTLGLESSHLAACIAEVHKRRYQGVFGSGGFDFRESSLDALAELPPLQSIWFWDVALKSVAGLYAQPTLRSMGVATQKRPVIEFSRLPALESLVWFYKSTDTGVGTLYSLQELYLWHHNTKERSFRDL